MSMERKWIAAKWLTWVTVFLFVFGGAAHTFARNTSSTSSRTTGISRLARGSESKNSDDKKKDDDKNKDSDKGSQGKGYGG